MCVCVYGEGERGERGQERKGKGKKGKGEKGKKGRGGKGRGGEGEKRVRERDIGAERVKWEGERKTRGMCVRTGVNERLSCTKILSQRSIE